jgi:hypothetical protein
MARSFTERIGRVVRLVVTVGVLALVLGAMVASPAAANQRGDAVTAANDFIYGCVANGGDPFAEVSTEGYIGISCRHENDRIQSCEWDASNEWNTKCWFSVRSPDGDGRSLDIGDEITQGQAAGR